MAASLLLLCAASAAIAQTSSSGIPGFSPTTFSRSDGLPQNGITALANTTDGYLWIGTQAGLSRFDGVSFTNFDERNNPEFKDHFITSLEPGSRGDLWIGTRNGLLRRSTEGAWIPFATADGLASEYVRTLFLGGDDTLLVGMYGGGLRSCTEIGGRELKESSIRLSDGPVRAILEDSKGILWVATATALHRYEEGAMTAYTMGDALAGNFVRSLVEGRAGDLWIGTEGGGLQLFHDGRFENYSRRVGIAENATIWTLLVDRDGDLWVGTEEQGVRRQLSSMRVRRLRTTSPFQSASRRLSLRAPRARTLWSVRQMTPSTMRKGVGGIGSPSSRALPIAPRYLTGSLDSSQISEL